MTRLRIDRIPPFAVTVFSAIVAHATAVIAEEPTVLRGRVVLADGEPAAYAQVAVIGNRTTRGDSDDDQGHAVLADAKSNENGEYELRLQKGSLQAHNGIQIVAREEGWAIAWHPLNLDAAETEVTIKLQPEAPIRGRAIDLEGQPAAGVRMSVESVIEPADVGKGGGGVGYRAIDKVRAAWIAPVTTDDDGRFVVHGVAADHGVRLDVAGNDRFAQQEIALNTGWAEKRGEHDGSYRPLIKNLKPGEVAVLALAPAQVFEGTVRYADSGEAAPHARVSIWASQREHGSMMTFTRNADENGRYHITPRPGTHFSLTAYPPGGTAYLARKSNAIRWEGSERVKQVDLTLPRGVLVRGRIVEAGDATPVAGAKVQYLPESANNRNESRDIVTGWQCVEATDEDGRFTIAVLPGPGRLLVTGPDRRYVLQEIGDRELGLGKPGGTRYYTHAVMKLDPKAGQDAVEVKLALECGATVKGRIVDEAGNAIDEALVISRLNIATVYASDWRGHTTPTLGGRFELTGLAEGVEYPIYFLDPKRRLGATEVINAGDQDRTVVLKPCGTARLRLVDGDGIPVPANYGLPEMVVTPGAYKYDLDALERGELAADADFITNIDPANHRFPNQSPSPDTESGSRTLNALIPGATYRVVGMRGGKLKVVKEFQVKPNETVDFGDITVER